MSHLSTPVIDRPTELQMEGNHQNICHRGFYGNFKTQTNQRQSNHLSKKSIFSVSDNQSISIVGTTITMSRTLVKGRSIARIGNIYNIHLAIRLTVRKTSSKLLNKRAKTKTNAQKLSAQTRLLF